MFAHDPQNKPETPASKTPGLAFSLAVLVTLASVLMSVVSFFASLGWYLALRTIAELFGQ
jgi:hypothetical protein